MEPRVDRDGRAAHLSLIDDGDARKLGHVDREVRKGVFGFGQPFGADLDERPPVAELGRVLMGGRRGEKEIEE